MKWKHGVFSLAVLLLSMAAVAQAPTGPSRWFVAGTVSHGKFVPFEDIASSAKPRWDKTLKVLSKQHAQGGSNEVINLAKYEGKAIFIFADKNGASSSDFYGVYVIGSAEKLLAEQLWKDSNGGGNK